MRQVSYIISTYTSDVSGVCSAFYEYGGMVVIHDPSGCNSTYNTHDEPRWFEKDSLIFISGLSQMDAVMGDDEKFIEEVVEAATELTPRFIILVRSPIPLMIGTDFEGIASEIEFLTGIPTYFIPTTGMKSYIKGVGMSLELIARELMPKNNLLQGDRRSEMDSLIRVNLLGVTPLDFSINTTYDSLKQYLIREGFRFQSCLSLDTDYESLSLMPHADVNLVVTASGFQAAVVMRERFGIPYVVGFPCGIMAEKIADAIRDAASTNMNHIVYKEWYSGQDGRKKSDAMTESSISEENVDSAISEDNADTAGILIHEPVIAQSLSIALESRLKRKILPAVMVECPVGLLDSHLIVTRSEEEIADIFKDASFVVADPMYQPVCPEEIPFYPLAHEAFSGRTYRRLIPDLMDQEQIISRIFHRSRRKQLCSQSPSMCLSHRNN